MNIFCLLGKHKEPLKYVIQQLTSSDRKRTTLLTKVYCTRCGKKLLEYFD